MAEVIEASSALDDIESIAGYKARDSVELASLFVSRLFDAIDRLQEFPFAGWKPE
jgi:plasmid stabilization system protein ParE